METLKTSQAKGILKIKLNRAPANAINQKMVDELSTLIKEAKKK